MVCLNCGNTFEGNFCPHCGQSAEVKRLQAGEMLKNAIGPFVGGDNRFLRTAWQLITRPGHLVRDYLLGKRIRYYHPLQMYVFLLTAYAITCYVLGINISIFDRSSDISFGDYERDGIVLASVRKVADYFNFIENDKLYGTLAAAIFAVPVFTWMFRKVHLPRPDGTSQPLCATENFYAQMYSSCIDLLLSTFLLPLSLIDGLGTWLVGAFSAITFAYVIVLYRQMLGLKWPKAILLCCIGFALTIALFVLFIFAIVVIAFGIDILMK